ncbi:GAF domain-containing protein [Deinococcus cellulosilyticus]|uniref:histidine kinase n=1 Tax=Deinococcus cellulosilyticus (strain DSM 18568 / NBRC 106333 / KACC 11606 / 5516J-15) TaxID=1223518 RepID=A0A511N3V9_DEIC1|nr:GAF domain-containing protein [Deinococcus cellulosilyticus]GEM47515.1 hypothetical protein DC3_31500 [Deinococcus cellulosilyticus NBRC 106333 = KACC 11606]
MIETRILSELQRISQASNSQDALRILLAFGLDLTRAHGGQVYQLHEGGTLRLLCSQGMGFALSAALEYVQQSIEMDRVQEEEHSLLLPIRTQKQCYALELIGANAIRTPDLIELRPVMGVLLEGILSREESASQTRETQAIAELTRRLGGSLDLSEVLRVIVEVAPRGLGMERAFLGLYQALGESSAETGRIFSYGFEGFFGDEETISLSPDTFKSLVVRSEPIVLPAESGHDELRQRLHRFGMQSCIILPLQARGKHLGVLYMDTTRERQRLLPDDVMLAKTFAEQASIAIDNARLYAEESRKRRVSESLRKVALALSSTLNLGEVLQIILQHAQGIFKAKACSIFQLSPDKKTLSIRSALGLETEFMLRIRARYGEGVVGRAVSENKPQIMPDAIENYHQNPIAWRNSYSAQLMEAGKYPFRGLIGAPLAARGVVFGGLCLYFEHAIQYDEEDLYVLEVFAGQAALAIENARLYEEEVRRERQAGILLQIARAFLNVTEWDWNQVCTDLSSVIGADRSAIVLLTSDYQVESSYTSELDPGEALLPVAEFADLFERSTAMRLPVGQGLPGAKNAICAPLYAQERLIGYVYADMTRAYSDFPEDEIHFLTAVADQMSLVLSNQRLFNALKRQEAQYRLLAEAAQDLIIATDREGNITYANPSTFKVLGFSERELIGRDYRSLLIHDGVSLNEVWNTGFSTVYQVHAYCKNGETAYLEMNLNPLTRAGQTIGYLAVARDLSEQHRLAEEITKRGQALALSQERQMELRTYLSLFTQAQEEERRRIARELHDDTAQVLVAITRRIDRLSKELDGTALKARAEDIRSDLETAINSVRRFARNLRPSILDDLGLLPALEWLACNAQTSTRLEVQGQERRLNSEVELTLFRVVQEALTNIDKHARANGAAIRVNYQNEDILVHVIDDGKGFEVQNLLDLAHQGHLGLLGLRERVELSGGSLEIVSAPGEGTELVFSFPT